MKDFLIYLFGIPGIFIILFLFVIIYLFGSKLKKARTLGMITLFVAFIFSNVATGQLLSSYLVKNLDFKKINSLSEVDLIVMPSQGVEYTGEITGWMPSENSFRAGNIAYDLQSRLSDRKVPVLICGGKNENDIIESEVIKSYFTRQFAQIKKTMTEDISKNLYEQAWQCSNMIKHYGAKNPVLVVDELQMLRTLALFRERGIEMVPVPVFTLTSERSWYKQYLPTLRGALLNQKVITEYLNIAFDFVNDRLQLKNLKYEKLEEI